MINEKISEVIDQQGNFHWRDAVLERILADENACRVWQRYHLIGCVLRGEVEETGADLSARIRARLEAEPTVLAPVRETSVIQSTRPKRKIFTRLRGQITPWKSAGVLALAASIALAAVITLSPVGLNSGDETTVAAVADGDARFAQEVGEMLAQHGEFTSSPGLNGLVVYAKLVSNEPIER